MRRSWILAGAALVMGCAAQAPTSSDAIAIWNDPSTGCKYIVYADGMGTARVGSLSIRFRADGKPDCPGDGIRPAARGETNTLEDKV